MPDSPEETEPKRKPSPAAKKRRRPAIIAAALSIPIGLTLGFLGDSVYHSGRVVRGVTVSGASVSGLDRVALSYALADIQKSLRERSVAVRVRDRSYELDPGAIGLTVDEDATVSAALDVGRKEGWANALGAWMARFFAPTDVPLSLSLSREKWGAAIAAWEREAVGEPPFEGCVVVRDGKPASDPPRAGTGIDREKAESSLLSSIASGSVDSVDLPLTAQDPKTPKETIDAAALRAKAMIGAAVTLEAEVLSDPPLPKEIRKGHAERLTLSPERDRLLASEEAPAEEETEADSKPARVSVTWTPDDLARALRCEPASVASPLPRLSFDAEAIAARLSATKPLLEQPPRDAAIVIDDRDHIAVVAGRKGRRLDAVEVASAVYDAATSTARSAALPVTIADEPSFATAYATSLGLTGLVSKFTTYHPCCQPRVKNIHRIADLLDGRLVRPGETFSVNQAVGKRTLASGFVPAPSIEDGEMVDTVGGGVSQFATTFFNAIFHGGYDIIERQAHSYYFSRYPMGHEATLSFPKPDLVFRNDTSAVVLIRATYTEKSITVKLFGDNGGRKVEAKVSPVQDVVKPPVELIADPKLLPDDEKVKDKGTIGWSVTVARILSYPDGTTKEEKRKVTYKPKARRVAVHPCHIPEGKEGYTGEPCPKPEEEEAESDGGVRDLDVDPPGEGDPVEAEP